MSKTTTMCPACLHDETTTAQEEEREAVYDEPQLLDWVEHAVFGNPGFLCLRCGYVGSSRYETYLFLDAVLHRAFPNCDSITDDGHYPDALRALKEES